MLHKTDYKEVEYADDNEMVVGSIISKDGNFIHALIHDEYVSSIPDIEKIEAFLAVVRKELE